ncbi:MAG: hypothetical protein FJY76_00980 [Candidatus Aenigmarchaeota archaeon]|nr:hypothetical protein [Candidatus Aenigmarchaeota archaeon]
MSDEQPAQEQLKPEQPKPEEPKQEKPRQQKLATNPRISEISQVRVSVAVNCVAAIIMGWASVVLTSMSRTLVAGIAGIVVMVVVGFITQKAVKNADRKWWLSNGIVVFLLVWLVSWTVFHNLGV